MIALFESPPPKGLTEVLPRSAVAATREVRDVFAKARNGDYRLIKIDIQSGKLSIKPNPFPNVYI